MTRKLGRLLVVALVVAAVVAPMTVASADIGEHLECNGIVYNPDNPNHVVYPEATIQVREYYDAWQVWNYRHWGDGAPVDIDKYIVFDMEDYFTGAPDPAFGGAFVFFWNDLLWDDPAIEDYWFVRIEGTQYNDIICGGPENDVILGRGGDDIIFGGSFVPSAGNDDQDVIRGGAGDDTLMGGWGYDGVSGGLGDDEVYGGFPEALYPGVEEMGPYPYLAPDSSPPDHGNELFGGAGDDLIMSGTTGHDLGHAGTGNDTMTAELNDDGVAFYGGAGDDTIVGGEGDDYLDGTTGNDTIWGMDDADTILGGAGDDVLYSYSPGTSAADSAAGTGLFDETDGDELYGNGGNDQLWGGLGDERALFGGPGNDVIKVGTTTTKGDACRVLNTIGDPGHDNLSGCLGGPGADTMTASLAGGPMYGGSGDDTLLGGPAAETLNGNAGGDLIYGYGGIDNLFGNAGDDTIYGGADNDYIMGGAGYDDLFGEAGDDDIFGDAVALAASDGADWISGGDGADEIIGGGGADVLYGDGGADWLTGGAFAPPWNISNPDGGAADQMFGGAGGDLYQGACADLDKATEDADPAADTDLTYFVPGLFPFITYFENAPSCP